MRLVKLKYKTRLKNLTGREIPSDIRTFLALGEKFSWEPNNRDTGIPRLFSEIEPAIGRLHDLETNNKKTRPPYKDETAWYILPPKKTETFADCLEQFSINIMPDENIEKMV